MLYTCLRFYKAMAGYIWITVNKIMDNILPDRLESLVLNLWSNLSIELVEYALYIHHVAFHRRYIYIYILLKKLMPITTDVTVHQMCQC